MPRPAKTCTVNGCTDKHVGRGYCQVHYTRWRRHGDPLTIKGTGGTPAVEREGERWCIACEKWEPVGAFYPDQGAHGKRRTCKAQVQAAAREKWATDPEAMRLNRKRHILRTRYGITPETYDAMLAAQDGRCALCGAEECSAGRVFAVDHDHDTGAVRGLLCSRCNLAVGAIESRGGRAWADQALAYIEASTDWRQHAA